MLATYLPIFSKNEFVLIQFLSLSQSLSVNGSAKVLMFFISATSFEKYFQKIILNKKQVTQLVSFYFRCSDFVKEPLRVRGGKITNLFNSTNIFEKIISKKLIEERKTTTQLVSIYLCYSDFLKNRPRIWGGKDTTVFYICNAF